MTFVGFRRRSRLSVDRGAVGELLNIGLPVAALGDPGATGNAPAQVEAGLCTASPH